MSVLCTYIYALYRCAIETVRADVAGEQYLFGLTLAQSMCVVLAACAGLFHLLVLRGKEANRGLPPE